MNEKPDFVIRRAVPTGEAGNLTIPPALVGIDPLRGRASRGECPMKKSSPENIAFSGKAACARTPDLPRRNQPPLPPLDRGV